MAKNRRRKVNGIIVVRGESLVKRASGQTLNKTDQIRFGDLNSLCPGAHCVQFVHEGALGHAIQRLAWELFARPPVLIAQYRELKGLS